MSYYESNFNKIKLNQSISIFVPIQQRFLDLGQLNFVEKSIMFIYPKRINEKLPLNFAYGEQYCQTNHEVNAAR